MEDLKNQTLNEYGVKGVFSPHYIKIADWENLARSDLEISKSKLADEAIYQHVRKLNPTRTPANTARTLHPKIHKNNILRAVFVLAFLILVQ
jgi:hypothetical protein